MSTVRERFAAQLELDERGCLVWTGARGSARDRYAASTSTPGKS